MRTIFISVVILLFTQSLLGCAARRAEAQLLKPVASTVCLVIEGVGVPGEPFIRRKVDRYLTEDGFRLVDGNCDLTITYTTFHHGQWNLMEKSLFGTKSSYAWSTEGILRLQKGSTTIVEDQTVDIRDEDTMQKLLDELAEEIAEVVLDRFRPVTPPKS